MSQSPPSPIHYHKPFTLRFPEGMSKAMLFAILDAVEAQQPDATVSLTLTNKEWQFEFQETI